MGLAESAARLAMAQNEGQNQAVNDIYALGAQERMRTMGEELISSGDFTGQGMQRVLTKYRASPDEIKGLQGMLAHFKKVKPHLLRSRGGEGDIGPAGSVTQVDEDGQMKMVYTAKDPKEITPTNLSKLMQERDRLPKDDPRRKAYDDAIAKETTNKPEKGTQLEQYLAKYNSLPQGHPDRQVFAKAIDKLTQRTGTRVTQDAEGGLVIETNAPMDGEEGSVRAPFGALSKTTQKDIEGKYISASEALIQAENILADYKPEFLTLGGRWDAFLAEWKDKGGADLSPDESQMLKDYTRFRQKSFRMLNDYIKQITGAAMSATEQKRILKAMPNPGTNWHDGQGPTAFKEALLDVISDLKAVKARYGIMRRNGLTLSDAGLDLDDVRDIMNKRGEELAAKMREQNPQMPEPQIMREVVSQLNEEYLNDKTWAETPALSSETAPVPRSKFARNR